MTTEQKLKRAVKARLQACRLVIKLQAQLDAEIAKPRRGRIRVFRPALARLDKAV